MNSAQALACLLLFFFLHLFQKRIFLINGTGFYGPDAHPVTLPTVPVMSKHMRYLSKGKVYTGTQGPSFGFRSARLQVIIHQSVAEAAEEVTSTESADDSCHAVIDSTLGCFSLLL